jgi:uncharacterized protein DUF397
MGDMTPIGGNEDERKTAGSWRKSSYSMSNGQCVEISCLVDGRIGVRDSQAVESAGPVLHFGHHAWSAFMAGLRASR